MLDEILFWFCFPQRRQGSLILKEGKMRRMRNVVLRKSHGNSYISWRSWYKIYRSIVLVVPARWFLVCWGFLSVATSMYCAYFAFSSRKSFYYFFFFNLGIAIWFFGYWLQFNLFIPGFSSLVSQSLVMFSDSYFFRSLKYFLAISFKCCTSCIMAI